MGFFDDVVTPDDPEPPPPPEFIDLGPPHIGPTGTPSDHFLPATVPAGYEVGAADFVRIMLDRFSVWPDAVTVHLHIFARRTSTGAAHERHRRFGQRPRTGDLRVGMLLADGRRVTTLDGDPYPPGSVARLSLHWAHGALLSGGFHRPADLLLSGLPPEGPTVLIVEWPDESIPETRAEIDAASLHRAASRVVEIWPNLPPPPQHPQTSGSFIMISEAAPSVARAAFRAPRPAAPVPDRYEPRADWQYVRHEHWADLRLVRARLAAGAGPTASIDVFGTRPPPADRQR